MDKIIKNLYGKAGIYCIVNTINQKKYIGRYMIKHLLSCS